MTGGGGGRIARGRRVGRAAEKPKAGWLDVFCRQDQDFAPRFPLMRDAHALPPPGLKGCASC
eukprot:3391582-Pyramimonas_sp.AAC.2